MWPVPALKDKQPKIKITTICLKYIVIMYCFSWQFVRKYWHVLIGRHENLEKILLTWLTSLRSLNIPINSKLLSVGFYFNYNLWFSNIWLLFFQVKAMEATAVLKINKFKASNDLIDKFKSRHSIVFKTWGRFYWCSNWQKDVLQQELSKFLPNNILGT